MRARAEGPKATGNDVENAVEKQKVKKVSKPAGDAKNEQSKGESALSSPLPVSEGQVESRLCYNCNGAGHLA